MTQRTHLLAIRIIGIFFVCVLLFCSWRIAIADLLADSSTPGTIRRAVSLEPGNLDIRTRQANHDLFDLNIPRKDVENEFRTVLVLNPRSSESMMALGLLAEARHATSEAETLLIKAAETDHTFKPAWTLANFYVRTNQINKMWAPIRAALEITTKPKLNYFDLNSIFDLCWNMGADPSQILAVIPKRAEAVLPYFYYLVLHQHREAALELYPQAALFADSSVPINHDSFSGFCNMLFRAKDIRDAVNVWNLMVQKHLISSTMLDVNQPASLITNASFELPLEPWPFGWLMVNNKGINSSYTLGALWFEFTGDQQDTAVLLDKNLPVVPGHNYLLGWVADGSRIRIPADPEESGLGVQFYNDDKTLPAHCSKFIGASARLGCSFSVPEKVEAIRMVLLYQRPLGSVRLRGTVKVSQFRLTSQGQSSP